MPLSEKRLLVSGIKACYTEINSSIKSEFEEVIKMLILCSNGLSSDMLLSQLSSKVVDCKTAALVVTADNEYKENNYHVPRVISELLFPQINLAKNHAAYLV